MDPEFQENIEQYFVENIKVGHIIYRHGVCVCVKMIVVRKISENVKVDTQ